MKNKLLKVCGILMIVGGAITVITGIIAIADAGLLLASAGAEQGLMNRLYMSMVIAIIGGVIEFLAGIAGVRNCANQTRAQDCIVWGIIVIVVCVLSNVLTLIAYPQAFSILSVIIGLVLPVLYLIGAVQLKKTSIA